MLLFIFIYLTHNEDCNNLEKKYMNFIIKIIKNPRVNIGSIKFIIGGPLYFTSTVDHWALSYTYTIKITVS